jgi:tetratricopeptide (TPR) repeat protein
MSNPTNNRRQSPIELTRSSRYSLALFLCSLAAFGSSAHAQSVIDSGPRDSRPRQGNAIRPSSRQTGRNDSANNNRNQPGLGGGVGLDRNLQRGSGGVNSPVAQPNFAARNLLATGNVAGGRGFRGSVGYTGASDFRSSTGSDGLFRFQADSALSAPSVLALRTNDRLALAQDFGLYEFRRESTPERITSSGAPTQRFRLDRVAASLASTQSFELDAEGLPFSSGTDSANRQVDFVASPIQGLRMRRTNDPVTAAGLTTFERARVRQDITQGLVNPDAPTQRFSSPLIENRPNAALDPKRLDTRVKDPVADQQSSYDQVVRRVIEQYGDDPNIKIDANSAAVARAKADLKRVRDALGGRFGEPDENDPLVDPVTKLPKPPAGESATEKPADAGSAEAERERQVEEAKQAVGAAASRLRHGTVLRDLSSGERARIDELVQDGQTRLADGDFFRAERCFSQALELNPDNPLLYAGLAHSQLGAGLHLSAALTLRTLFSEHPEMIDTRYEQALLPNETRIRLAVETLRKRIAQGQDGDGYGLALAYLGHQLNEKDLIKEGLAPLTGTIENDLLNELLSEIWLKEKPAPSSESPTPQAPASESPPNGEPSSEKAKPAEEPSK